MEDVVESLVVGKCFELDPLYHQRHYKLYVYNERWGNVCIDGNLNGLGGSSEYIANCVERGDKILCSRSWCEELDMYLYGIQKDLTIEEIKEKFVAQQKTKQSEIEETKATKHQMMGLCEVRYGKPVCRITGKHCDKISKVEIKQNTELKNLCEIHKCVLARNFKKIIENQH